MAGSPAKMDSDASRQALHEMFHKIQQESCTNVLNLCPLCNIVMNHHFQVMHHLYVSFLYFKEAYTYFSSLK